MKNIVKDGQVLRLDEEKASYLVKNCGYKYTSKSLCKSLFPNSDDPNHDTKIREIHTQCLRVYNEEVKSNQKKTDEIT
jgi:hypothetical protein